MHLEIDGKRVKIGREVKSSNGQKGKLVQIAKPHKPGSTGRVYVDIDGGEIELFPSVIGAIWVGRTDQ